MTALVQDKVGLALRNSLLHEENYCIPIGSVIGGMAGWAHAECACWVRVLMSDEFEDQGVSVVWSSLHGWYERPVQVVSMWEYVMMSNIPYGNDMQDTLSLHDTDG